MAPDLEQLLRQTAPSPTGGLDIEQTRRRVRRRRFGRRLAGAGVVAVVVTVGALVVPSILDGPRVVPDIADESAHDLTPSHDAAAYGPELDLRAFPALADHGVAIEQDGRIVFVGVDGTVHGHLRGRFHPHPSLQTVTHLLPVATDDAHVWLDPATGATMGMANIEMPLIGGHQVTYFADVPAEQRQELVRATATATGETAESLATWPEYTPYWVTPDHRVVTYLPCGDVSCPQAYDLDMGGAIELEAGCHVAAVLGDLAVTEICDEGRELRVWDPDVGGLDARRVIPVPEGTDARPARAVGVFGGIVHVAHASCGIHEAMSLDGDRLVPLLTGPSVEERGSFPSHVPLGVLPHGEVVVHLHGGVACEAGAQRPGIAILDRATTELTTVHEGTFPAAAARLWSPTPAISSQPDPEEPAG